MEKFQIIRNYLKQINFDSPHAPEIFFKTSDGNSRLCVNYNTNTQKTEDSSLYNVYLECRIDAIDSDGQIVFTVNSIWGAVVAVDEKVEEEELKDILCGQVPQRIFDPQRVLLYLITNNSGFPPVLLKDFEFSRNNGSNATVSRNEMSAQDGKTTDIIPDILDWGYAIDHLTETNDEAQKSIDLYEENIGDPFDFDTGLLNRYLYRFVPKVFYKHPDIFESYCYVYDILPQLLYCDPEAVCQLIPSEDGDFPEFQYTYKGETRKISELSREELLSLLDKLLVTAFSETACNLYRMNKDEMLCDSLPDGSFNIITREEYFALLGHGTNDKELDEEIEKMYERIKFADEQSFIHRIF